MKKALGGAPCCKTGYTALFLSIIVLILSSMPSCTSIKAYWNLDADLIESNYKAADQLMERAFPPISPQEPILVATFPHVDNLEVSSALGRTIADQMASRFSQREYRVVQMKLRTAVFMKKSEGEFILSRELQNISREHNANYVVAGTYSVGNYVIYVSASVIRLSDNRVVSSYDYRLPLGANNAYLLGSQSGRFGDRSKYMLIDAN